MPLLPREKVDVSIQRIAMITNVSGSPAGPLISGGETGPKAVKVPASSSVTGPEGPDAPANSQKVALAGRVIAQPNVRAEEVQRAKALVASPNYPPRAIVEAVARLVAESNHVLD